MGTWRRRRAVDARAAGDPSGEAAAAGVPAGEAGSAGPAGDRAGPAEAHEPPDGALEGGLLDAPPPGARRPLYHRLLRLRHISPTAWQRAAFADAPLALAVVLVLADVASAWTLLVLPVAVAVVVKTHDVLAGALAGPAAPPPRGEGPPD